MTRELWKLQELGARVAWALSLVPVGSLDGRTRDVPDGRTIRYYTSLGLVSRPAAMRGRTAYYSQRHLLQVVAIKRLQARGFTLAEIQKRLTAITVAELEAVAQVPEEVLSDRPVEPAVARGAGASEDLPEGQTGRAPDEEVPSADADAKRRKRSFWTEAPAESRADDEDSPPVVARAPRPAGRTRPEPAGDLGPTQFDEPPSAQPLIGVNLGAGVTLLIGAERQMERDDLQAIAAASAPLLKVLASRRLTQARFEEGKEE